jgi:hypothetical protein
MEKELVMFSGGPDSTLLLDHLLKQGKFLHVSYIQMSYENNRQENIKLQNETVKNILTYFKKKGYSFDYTSGGIFLDLFPSEPRFGSDDQWTAFFAGMLCRKYNMKKFWTGHYDYAFKNRMKLKGEFPQWIVDGTMLRYAKYGAVEDPNFKDIQHLTPANSLKNSLNLLKTKKEAFDSLEPELKKLVRSCFGNTTFCGTCYKCDSYIQHGIKNKKGKLL